MPQLMRTVERRKPFARAARRGFADRETAFASGRAAALWLGAEAVHALRADAAVHAFCVSAMASPRRTNCGTKRMAMEIISASVGVAFPSTHSTLSDETTRAAIENASKTFTSMSPWQRP